MLEPAIAERLVEVLSDRFGASVTIRDRKQLELAQPPRRVSSMYARYEVAVGNEPQPVSVFVKSGTGNAVVRNPALERFIGEQDDPLFHAPRFLGDFQVNGRRTAVWEYVAGRQPALKAEATEDLKAIVAGVAGVNAVTDRAVDAVPGIPLGTPWIVPISEPAAEWLAELGTKQAADLERRLRRFALVEPELIDRLTSFEHRLLTHHDIKAENLIFQGSERRITLIDWASASISAPGTGLRFVARFDPSTREMLASHYARCMGELGYRITPGDALFALHASQAFWGLTTGYKRRNARRVQRGLDLIDEAF